MSTTKEYLEIPIAAKATVRVEWEPEVGIPMTPKRTDLLREIGKLLYEQGHRGVRLTIIEEDEAKQ